MAELNMQHHCFFKINYGKNRIFQKILYVNIKANFIKFYKGKIGNEKYFYHHGIIPHTKAIIVTDNPDL